MTFVGKILVIVIVAMSLVFLGISTVSLSTARNWTAAIQKDQTTVKELTKKLADAKGQAEAAKKGLDDTKGQFDQEKKTLETKLTAIQEEITRDLNQTKSVREQWAGAHEKAKGAMAEVEAKRTQTNDIRAQRGAAEKQSQQFKNHQVELTDLIRELERLRETADKNGSDLVGR
jgi:chromosome segregation ATPase